MARGTLMALVVFTGASIGAAEAVAQAPTTVQLPTFSSFSVSTTVVVPDRGSVLLGGVDRAASGEISRGVPGLSHIPGVNRLFKNRASGRETSSSTASVSVWVHDLPAMDEALLAEAAARRVVDDTTLATPSTEKARQLTRHLAAAARFDAPQATAAPQDRPASLAEIRAQLARQSEQTEAEARDLVAQGDRAQADGKPAVAKLFYQMAARRAPTTMGSVVQSRLQLLAARK